MEHAFQVLNMHVRKKSFPRLTVSRRGSRSRHTVMRRCRCGGAHGARAQPRKLELIVKCALSDLLHGIPPRKSATDKLVPLSMLVDTTSSVHRKNALVRAFDP